MKIILGARSYGGKWKSVSNKVTNMNVMSSLMSVEEMENMTRRENCAIKGNYLAWENMEWILHGKARLEQVDINEPCEGAPLANFFPAPFPGWDSCMQHCEKLGRRAPFVITFEHWITLQTFWGKRSMTEGETACKFGSP